MVIWDNVLIGWDVQIIDSDFHPLDQKFRKSNQANSSPIYIGENAWIGSNVRISRELRLDRIQLYRMVLS